VNFLLFYFSITFSGERTKTPGRQELACPLHQAPRVRHTSVEPLKLSLR